MRKVIALVALGGCSFATMRSPHGSPPECTDKQAAPFLDIVLAVASPFVAYAMFRSSDTSSDADTSLHRFIDGVAAVAVSFPAWGTFGASSIYGYVKADRCYRAKRDYEQLMNAPPTPGVYAPPPIAPGPSGEPPPQAPLPMVPPGPQPMPPSQPSPQ